MEGAFASIANQCKDLIQVVHTTKARAHAYSETHAADGISLLDAKTAALLLYTSSLCRYAAARVLFSDESDVLLHSNQLVNQWVTLERIRPLEKKLRPQISSFLLRATKARAPAPTSSSATARAPALRPDPSALMLDPCSGDDDDDDDNNNNNNNNGESDGDRRPEPATTAASGRTSDASGPHVAAAERLYRAPRIAEVAFVEGAQRAASEARAQRARERMSARAERSRGVQEILAEVRGRPELVRAEGADGADADVREVARMRREEEERTRYEEENLTRLNVTRKDKRRRRLLERAAETAGTDAAAVVGGDAFADLMGVADRVIGKGAAKRGAEEREREWAMDAFEREEGEGARGGNGRRAGRQGKRSAKYRKHHR